MFCLLSAAGATLLVLAVIRRDWTNAVVGGLVSLEMGFNVLAQLRRRR